MRSPVARLRLSATALAATLFVFTNAPLAAARDEVLFTSSVSYCAPPELVLVQQFDVTYFSANSSVFFNISAASVEPNINVTAHLLLNVYGMQPVNLTVDLCGILGGALCPLPTYNFTGSEIIPLPSGLDVASRLPGIAYKIPDLEAFAQLTLTRADTGEVKACVQSTLSNGWSTRQPGVSWGTGALALLALLSAVFHSRPTASPEALAPFRLVDLMALYQSIGASALLNLNYPVVYRSFAANFAWALGLFAGSEHIQDAIDNLRHKTGGTMPDASRGSAIDLVNRRLSPYNVAPGSPGSAALATIKSLVQHAQTKRDVVTVTAGSTNILEAGIPLYVNALGIATANAFMSVFFTLLILAAIALAAFGIGWIAIIALLRYRQRHGRETERLEEWRTGYAWVARAWALRLALIALSPVLVFAFAQWTLKDSWLATLFSVLTLLGVLGAVLVPAYGAVRLARRERPWALYRHTPTLMTAGPLYVQFRHPRFFFALVLISAAFVRALAIAFASANGLAQLVVLLLVEVGVLGATVLLRPHETRGGDVLGTTLAVARLVGTAMLFVFVERFGVQPIPRVAVGIVVAVLFSLSVILMFVNTLWNLRVQDLPALWRRRFGTRVGSSLGSSRSPKGSLMEEKGSADALAVPRDLEAADTERPRNPTPLRNVPLDPALNEPYPEVTPTATFSSVPSSAFPSPRSPSSFASLAYAQARQPVSSPGETIDSGFQSSASGSTTLGSALPRRPSYEGLGLDGLAPADVDGEAHSVVPSTATESRFASAPTSPLTNSDSNSASRRGSCRESYRESWAPSPLRNSLPLTSEGHESPNVSAFGHDRELSAAR